MCHEGEAYDASKKSLQQWKRDCKYRWNEKQLRTDGIVASIARAKSFRDVKQDVHERYPGESKRAYRERVLSSVAAVAAGIIRAMSSESAKVVAKRLAAFKRWNADIEWSARNVT